MRPENVLLVEDNDLLRLYMVHFFLKAFQRVLAVGTGTDAMEQIEESFYHMVILDKNLPDVDGLEVLAHIREKSPHSRVVMNSADADERIRREALKRGAFEFYEKPFDIKKLKAALKGMRVSKSLKARIAAKYRGGTCNLSDSGMLLITDAVLACGTTIDILLHTPENREIPLQGRVIRSIDSHGMPPQCMAPQEEMRHAVGIQLVGPPPEYYSLVDSLIL